MLVVAYNATTPPRFLFFVQIFHHLATLATDSYPQLRLQNYVEAPLGKAHGVSEKSSARDAEVAKQAEALKD